MTVLILGGTAEARALAAALDGRHVISSLAGRVARPRLPVGEVRIGGFGGIDGLRSYLRQTRVRAVVDATHPFAAQITGHAAIACAAEDVPLLRLARPGWQSRPAWHWVDDHDAAAASTRRLGGRPFLTTGRQSLDCFAQPLAELGVLVRLVDEPQQVLPPSWSVVVARGPYTLESERAVFADHGVDVLVTKDSGGDYTRAKLDVAEELDVPVVVVRRPATPFGVRSVPDVESAVAWLAV